MIQFLSRTVILAGLALALHHPLNARPLNADSVAVAARLIADATRVRTTRPAYALVTLQQAIGLLKGSGDVAMRLSALRAKRDLEMDHAAYEAALRTCQDILGESASSGDRNALANDLTIESELHERTEGIDLAVDAAKRALLIRRSMSDSAGCSAGYLRLLELLAKAGRYAEFKRNYQDAVEACVDDLCHSRVQLLQGRALIAQARPADALPILVQANKALERTGTPDDRINALLALTEAETGLSLWTAAKGHLASCMALLRSENKLFSDHRVFGLSAAVAEGSGNIAEALQYQKRQFQLRDSLLDERRSVRMASLQALYATGNDQRDLRHLREEFKASTDLLEHERDLGRWFRVMIVTLSVAVTILLLMAVKLRRTMLRERSKSKVIRRQSEEIRQKNLEMERRSLRLAETLVSEEEKELQLKEIHHRVKNNLQIVSTLLRMQGATSKDQRYAELMRDCQGRLHSMALVHEHIYMHGDLSRVNVKAHVMALSEAVVRNYGLQNKVTVDLRINYDQASLDELIPLSLLLNELLTNSAKYAFNGREQGRISVVLKRNPTSGECELQFSDDGTGLSQEEFLSKDSFGLELVRTLAAQLNGTMQLLTGAGTTLRMVFHPDERPVRKAS